MGESKRRASRGGRSWGWGPGGPLEKKAQVEWRSEGGGCWTVTLTGEDKEGGDLARGPSQGEDLKGVLGARGSGGGRGGWCQGEARGAAGGGAARPGIGAAVWGGGARALRFSAPARFPVRGRGGGGGRRRMRALVAVARAREDAGG